MKFGLQLMLFEVSVRQLSFGSPRLFEGFVVRIFERILQAIYAVLELFSLYLRVKASLFLCAFAETPNKAGPDAAKMTAAPADLIKDRRDVLFSRFISIRLPKSGYRANQREMRSIFKFCLREHKSA